jgi:ankyrin repeat protein
MTIQARRLLAGCVLSLVVVAGCAPVVEAPTVGLGDAIESGNVEQVRRHIHHPSLNTNAPSPGRDVPLHMVARVKEPKPEHLEIAKLMIEDKADVNARGYDGQTPLHEAARAGSVAMVRLLLDHGADATLKNNDGHTSLQQAEQAQHQQVVELLKGR